MSRAEHTYGLGELKVQLIVPDGVVAPRWLEVKQADEVVRLRHEGVRNLRAPSKRVPRIEGSTIIPEDWTPPAAEVERLRVECPSVNLEHELAQLIDWYRGKGQRMKDWTAVWRRWIRKAHADHLERGWKPSRATAPQSEDPRAKWCREHGVTVEEYEARKGDREWLEMIKRRGVVA